MTNKTTLSNANENLIFYTANVFGFSVRLTRTTDRTTADFGSFLKLAGHITLNDFLVLNENIDIFNIKKGSEIETATRYKTSQPNGTKNAVKMFDLVKRGYIAFLNDKHLNSFINLANLGNLQEKSTLTPILREYLSRFKCHTKHATALSEMIINHQLKGYTLEIATESEIIEAYQKFSSCMTKYAHLMPLFYGTPYDESGNISVSIMVLKRNGYILARGLYRHKSNKIIKCYGDSALMQNVAKMRGIKCDIGAAIGARLPIVTDDNGCLRIPYIDSEQHRISLKLNENNAPQYLVIDSKDESLTYIGEGNNQDLSLNYARAYHDFFDDEPCKDFTGESVKTCSNCECEVDEHDYRTDAAGNILCDDCSSYCEECDETVLSDEITEFFYRARNGEIETGYCCQSCADYMQQIPFRR